MCYSGIEPLLTPLAVVLDLQRTFSYSCWSDSDLAPSWVGAWLPMAVLGQLLLRLAWVAPHQVGQAEPGFLMRGGCVCRAEMCLVRRWNDEDELCWGAASSPPTLFHY